MSLLMAGVSVVSGIASAIGSRKKEKRARRQAAKARARMEEQKAAFADLDTSNPYLNMENTMEDLTVNQQQAQFEAQQFQQSQSNVLDSMRGSAGGSGIANLAQAMAQQGQLASQRSSASIGAQESTNQRLERQEASRIQGMERQGEVMSRNMERNKVSTLLGMEQGAVAGYEDQAAAYDANKMAGFGAAIGGITGNIDSIEGLFKPKEPTVYDPNNP